MSEPNLGTSNTEAPAPSKVRSSPPESNELASSTLGLKSNTSLNSKVSPELSEV